MDEAPQVSAFRTMEAAMQTIGCLGRSCAVAVVRRHHRALCQELERKHRFRFAAFTYVTK